VVLAKSGTILKTASGKIQRSACKRDFLEQKINVIADWSENPKLMTRYRDLASELESLEAQVKRI
jgi:hypothetical protein